jgi:hypothetical protein
MMKPFKIFGIAPTREKFPWVIFFLLTVLFLIGVSRHAHSEEDIWACYASQRYQAMSSGWPACNEMSYLCSRVQQYLQSHTIEEGRAEGEKLHIPQWLRAKAERCIPK